MNFDFPDVELVFRLADGHAGAVFYLCFEWNGKVNEVAGMNAAGLFSAAQILVAHFEIHPQPSENLLRPYELFSHALRYNERTAEVLEFLGGHRLGYTSPRKGHQLYADRFGNTCILEPAPGGNCVYPSSEPFAVMANRPLQRELERMAKGDGQPGTDRFQMAYHFISEKLACANGSPGRQDTDGFRSEDVYRLEETIRVEDGFQIRDGFDIKDGFEVLRRTTLSRGRFTTQASMVCDPQAGELYLALHQDFDKLWKVKLSEHTIETHSGFKTAHKIPLGEAGVTATELRENARL
jgi:hypothetical protein